MTKKSFAAATLAGFWVAAGLPAVLASEQEPAEAEVPADAAPGAKAVFGGGIAVRGATFRPCAFTRDWTNLGSVPMPEGDIPGAVHFRLKAGKANDDPAFDGYATFAQSDDGGIGAAWRVVPERDADIAETFISGEVSFGIFGGGKAVIDGKDLALTPYPAPKPHLFRGEVSTLSLFDRDGAERYRFEFESPTRILLQDNRHWMGNNLVLRFYFATGAVTAGTEYAIAAKFSTPADGPLALDNAAGTYRLDAGGGWTPLRYEPWIEQGSALDFTLAIPRHEPAGKFGRVVSVGNHFEFEGLPGVRQRFYGANLCGEANLPKSEEEAERFVSNIARIGYNSLRIHHHEKWLVRKDGKLPPPEEADAFGGTALDPAQMDKLDLLVAACVRHGIYLTTDLYVSRAHVISWRSLGIDRDGPVPQDMFKLLVAFHEPAFENLVEWTRNFLGHVNPYTGRSLAEEPALATLALVNEGNLGNFGVGKLQEVPGMAEAWSKWCQERGIGEKKPDLHDGAFVMFLAERETQLFERLKAVVRDECGCQAPLSSISAWFNPVQYQAVREKFDYVDAHFYVDHPQFLGDQWRLPSRSSGVNPLLGTTRGVPKIAFTRLLEKPFCVTEFNYSGPGRYRGLGGIATGAIAALQDWDGIWRFAWSHGRYGIVSPGGRLGYFDVCGDPLALASERAATCLFLRGDIAEHDGEAPVVLDAARLADPTADAPECNWPGSLGKGWTAKIGTTIDGGRAAPAASANQPVTISADGTFLIDTPRTAGGFAESGTHTAGAVTFALLPNGDAGNAAPGSAASRSTPATIWASSLDGKDLAESSHILVSHLTDVQNTGSVYADPELTILLDWGRSPHIMRTGAATVELLLDSAGGNAGDDAPAPREYRECPAVYRLSSSGRRIAEVPCTVEPVSGGARCDTAHTAVRLSSSGRRIGEVPCTVEPVSGGARCDTAHTAVRLSSSGRRIGEVPCTVEPVSGGARCDTAHTAVRLSFTARTDYDPAAATYLYEIVRE